MESHPRACGAAVACGVGRSRRSPAFRYGAETVHRRRWRSCSAAAARPPPAAVVARAPAGSPGGVRPRRHHPRHPGPPRPGSPSSRAQRRRRRRLLVVEGSSLHPRGRHLHATRSAPAGPISPVRVSNELPWPPSWLRCLADCYLGDALPLGRWGRKSQAVFPECKAKKLR